MEGRQLEEEELIDLARRGDHSAYGELVKRYQAIAIRTAYLVAGEAGEAEDATQEAFVKAYRSLDRFKDGSPFRPWLLKIVANEARNRARASHRRRDLALRGAAHPPLETEPTPEMVAEANADRKKLLDALNRLGEKDRVMIGLRYFLDLSETEAAKLLEIPRGTAKSRLSRALRRLRKLLSADLRAEGDLHG